jgi:hypothetical protein
MAAKKKKTYKAKWVDLWYNQETSNELDESWFLDVSIQREIGYSARAWITKGQTDKRYKCIITVGPFRVEKQTHKALYNAQVWCCNKIREFCTCMINAHLDIIDRIPYNEKEYNDLEKVVQSMTL